MRYHVLILILVIPLSYHAQTNVGEKPMVTFKIRPRPPASDVRTNLNFRPQTLSLNEIFNQYRLNFKPHKEDPANIQELLNYQIDHCIISYVVKNFIREDESDKFRGYDNIRTLYPGDKVFFEKVQLRSPDGKYYYIKKVRAIKRS
jgi:hypothetical protein